MLLIGLILINLGTIKNLLWRKRWILVLYVPNCYLPTRSMQMVRKVSFMPLISLMPIIFARNIRKSVLLLLALIAKHRLLKGKNLCNNLRMAILILLLMLTFSQKVLIAQILSLYSWLDQQDRWLSIFSKLDED